jgi:UDP-N-acetylmuramyl tripeptide synthase
MPNTNPFSFLSHECAIIVGKVAARAIRFLGYGLGSNLPGKLANKISPKLLPYLSAKIQGGIIAVSGTNGKSTTSGLIASILNTAKFKIIHNKQGANLYTGITTCLIDNSDWLGNIEADWGIFEIDEAALPQIARQTNIDYVIVTNLFRDQLDRFGELDTTFQLIKQGIEFNKSKTILNADDPNIAQLVENNVEAYYGIKKLSNQSSVSDSEIRELAYCSFCGNEFKYNQIFYGQLGDYYCSNCENKRPNLNIFADNIHVLAQESSFDLWINGNCLSINLKLPGLFNVYNALAAASIAHILNVNAETIKHGLENYSTLFGRSEKIVLHNKTILIQLIKNPAGASQTVKAACHDPNARIIIAINDNLADGRDVSWLWDTEFEVLSKHTNEIIVSGKRCYDMATRLKYAGVPEKNIIVKESLKDALLFGIDLTNQNQTLWILPTYTCLLDLQKIVKSLGYSLSGT